MHEFHGVKTFIDQIARKMMPKERVAQIHVKLGIGFFESPVRMAFLVHSRGTPLEGAELVLVPSTVSLRCICGQPVELTEENHHGPAVCLYCGEVVEIPVTPDLELIDLVYVEPHARGSRRSSESFGTAV